MSGSDKRRKGKGEAKELPGGVPAPRHIGELWQVLQEIAREEDRRFAEKSVAEHFQSGAEGMKDIERWLEIYHRRINPERRFRFAAHHRRYRGYCLMARSWPGGVVWEAFDDETLRRLAIPGQPDKENLARRIDEHLVSGRRNDG